LNNCDFSGITLLGLGPGAPGQLTREAWEIIAAAKEIYLRTSQHPVVADLPSNVKLYSFDELYQQLDHFEQVYDQIVERILEMGRSGERVIYAVPGHPFVAESTGPAIWRLAKAEGIPVRVVEGLSFLGPTFTALEIDPLPNTAIIDALELLSAYSPVFPPDAPALIAQLYSRFVASETKLTLMALYPDEHPVVLVHAAGTQQERIEHLPLHTIDQSDHIGLLTSLFVPPLGDFTSFEGFQGLIAHLRAPEGCPWDREQTHRSLRSNLLEEAYEAITAIDREDVDAMQEELGDLLLQVVLQAQIAAEDGEFTIADVIRGIHTKLLHRHPHVFGDMDLVDADDVIKNWERIKAQERDENGQDAKGLLDGIPTAMPALSVAEKYQNRAARVGFDWPSIEGVLDKLEEELNEFREAGTLETQSEELGDLLFALVNLARWLEIDPETALRETNHKFLSRFKFIEETAKERGVQLSDLTLEEMDRIWEESKKGKK
jgi:tetrapyrrole methylase family protein/MazG family protein